MSSAEIDKILQDCQPEIQALAEKLQTELLKGLAPVIAKYGDIRLLGTVAYCTLYALLRSVEDANTRAGFEVKVQRETKVGFDVSVRRVGAEGGDN